jgi:hypothetical protein
VPEFHDYPENVVFRRCTFCEDSVVADLYFHKRISLIELCNEDLFGIGTFAVIEQMKERILILFVLSPKLLDISRMKL